MKILTKLALAGVLAASAAQAVQAEQLLIANGGGLGIQGYTPNPNPPYPAPTPTPIPWPGPACLSCPPFELKPDFPQIQPGFGGLRIQR